MDPNNPITVTGFVRTHKTLTGVNGTIEYLKTSSHGPSYGKADIVNGHYELVLTGDDADRIRIITNDGISLNAEYNDTTYRYNPGFSYVRDQTVLDDLVGLRDEYDIRNKNVVVDGSNSIGLKKVYSVRMDFGIDISTLGSLNEGFVQTIESTVNTTYPLITGLIVGSVAIVDKPRLGGLASGFSIIRVGTENRIVDTSFSGPEINGCIIEVTPDLNELRTLISLGFLFINPGDFGFLNTEVDNNIVGAAYGIPGAGWFGEGPGTRTQISPQTGDLINSYTRPLRGAENRLHF